MTRRERIVVLLENYMDVEHGLQDARPGQDLFVPQMCAAWRHPSYIELRRLLPLLRDSEPFVYWHLAEQFLRFHVRRMAVCPKCDRRRETPPGWAGVKGEPAILCNHGKRENRHSTAMVPRVVKRVSLAVQPELVSQGIDWIERHFQGEPFIPDELLALAA